MRSGNTASRQRLVYGITGHYEEWHYNHQTLFRSLFVECQQTREPVTLPTKLSRVPRTTIFAIQRPEAFRYCHSPLQYPELPPSPPRYQKLLCPAIVCCSTLRYHLRHQRTETPISCHSWL
ncbi:hypothetical protein J6590_043218 [Homalodisca vitripennis]|nr:hypothetical protein J6590_043218 [Homalodisca vitripennis]